MKGRNTSAAPREIRTFDVPPVAPCPVRNDLTAPAKPRFEVFCPQKFFARRRRLIRAIASHRIASHRIATHRIESGRIARYGIFRGTATERTRRGIANLIVASIKAHGRRSFGDAVIGRTGDGKGGQRSSSGGGDGGSTDTSADSR